jgi:hypothetical protein
MSSALTSGFAKAVLQRVQRRLQVARLPPGVGIGAGFLRKDSMEAPSPDAMRGDDQSCDCTRTCKRISRLPIHIITVVVGTAIAGETVVVEVFLGRNSWIYGY